MDGRWFSSGVPAGFSDLFGVRKLDGKAVFIEVKTTKGKPTREQKRFLEVMQDAGAIAGICRSKEEAITLVTMGLKNDTFESLHKITTVFEKFQELTELVLSLNAEERKTLMISLEKSLEVHDGTENENT